RPPPAGRPLVPAFEEDPFAVDRTRPLLELHAPQPGTDRTAVAQLVVAPPLDDRVVQRLTAERPRPPQRGTLDRHVPLDVVFAGRERLLELDAHVSAPR